MSYLLRYAPPLGMADDVARTAVFDHNGSVEIDSVFGVSLWQPGRIHLHMFRGKAAIVDMRSNSDVRIEWGGAVILGVHSDGCAVAVVHVDCTVIGALLVAAELPSLDVLQRIEKLTHVPWMEAPA